MLFEGAWELESTPHPGSIFTPVIQYLSSFPEGNSLEVDRWRILGLYGFTTQTYGAVVRKEFTAWKDTFNP